RDGSRRADGGLGSADRVPGGADAVRAVAADSASVGVPQWAPRVHESHRLGLPYRGTTTRGEWPLGFVGSCWAIDPRPDAAHRASCAGGANGQPPGRLGERPAWLL